MSINVCVPLANGFEEIEAVSLIDVMRRGGINVIVAGVGGDVIYGAHHIRIIPDTKIELVNADKLDFIVLPGGLPGAINLAEDKYVQKLLKEMDKQGKYVGAICAGPYALKTAGVLKDKYTAYPGWEGNIQKEGYVDEKVVEDKNVLTSKGPGTAMCFGLEIVKKFVGTDVYKQLKKELLADC